jgi:hypothetical protein
LFSKKITIIITILIIIIIDHHHLSGKKWEFADSASLRYVPDEAEP